MSYDICGFESDPLTVFKLFAVKHSTRFAYLKIFPAIKYDADSTVKTRNRDPPVQGLQNRK